MTILHKKLYMGKKSLCEEILKVSANRAESSLIQKPSQGMDKPKQGCCHTVVHYR